VNESVCGVEGDEEEVFYKGCLVNLWKVSKQSRLCKELREVIYYEFGSRSFFGVIGI